MIIPNDWLSNIDDDDDDNHQIIKINEVPGAFIIKKLLSIQECEVAAQNVKNIVCLDPKVNDFKSNNSNNSSNNSNINNNNNSNDDTVETIKRRNSQHHTPYHVKSCHMTKLCSRIRKYLIMNGITKAGPNHNNSELNDVGEELSPFLRLYDYHEGDYSTPHYDKSFTKHFETGALKTFSAYSVLIYLSNEKHYDGGETGFFKFTEEQKSRLKRSNKGNTLLNVNTNNINRDDKDTKDNEHEYEQILVKGGQGDVLVFPHGRHQGCYPDPYHQGCTVTRGNKILIRTDIIFKTKRTRQISKNNKRNQRHHEVLNKVDKNVNDTIHKIQEDEAFQNNEIDHSQNETYEGT